MTTQDYNKSMDEIKDALRDLWQSAVEARDAANDVLDQKLALDMRITEMQSAAMLAEQAALRTQVEE